MTFANHLGSVGGSETAQLGIFRELAERGWEVHLLYVSTGDYWPEWRSFVASATQIRASLPTHRQPLATSVGVLRAAASAAVARPSLLYVHNAGDAPVATAVGAIAGAPVVVHLHLPPPIRQPEWLNAVLRRTAALVAPSSDTAGRWITNARIDGRRMSVIPTGVDMARFKPLSTEERAAARAEIGVGAEELMVLYAGRIERKKGAHYLVEAVRRLSHPVHVVLCGFVEDPAYRDRLEREIEGCTATFLGLRSDVPALMGSADLVVVPSNWPETQGLVISEAMACGTPVIAFDVGGVADSMAGFPDQLVPAADAVLLAEAMDRYVAWRADSPDLGPRSRRWAEEHMSLGHSMDEVDELIQRTWNRRHGS